MATTTAEMQDLQEVNRGPDKGLATQGPSEQGGALGLTKGGSLPSLKEILAQPAVKKATPGIMIAILMGRIKKTSRRDTIARDQEGQRRTMDSHHHITLHSLPD